MRMKQIVLCCCVLSLVFLVGCESDRGIDAVGFCKEFNKLSQDYKIEDGDIIKESVNGDYIIGVKTEKSDNIIRIRCDGNGTVISCVVTGTDRDYVIKTAETAAKALKKEIPLKLLKEDENTEKSAIVETEDQRFAWFSGDGYFTVSVHEISRR